MPRFRMGMTLAVLKFLYDVLSGMIIGTVVGGKSGEEIGLA